MSAHWRLAIWYAVSVAAGTAVLGAVVWALEGSPYALSLGYGVLVGIVSMLSTAATVSFLTGTNEMLRMLGAMSFLGRYLFVLAALAVPAYLGAWPVLAMVLGFAGVYLAEHVLLIPGVMRRAGASGKAPEPAAAGLEAGEGAERSKRRMRAC